MEFDHNIIEIQAALQESQTIDQFVDEVDRRLFARIHSAGHLLDIAVKKIGLAWKPGKGYHFADSPYVEYIGSAEGLNLGDITKQL